MLPAQRVEDADPGADEGSHDIGHLRKAFDRENGPESERERYTAGKRKGKSTVSCSNHRCFKSDSGHYEQINREPANQFVRVVFVECQSIQSTYSSPHQPMNVECLTSNADLPAKPFCSGGDAL